MPTFNLTCYVTVSAFTVVEADTLDEAIAIAKERDVTLVAGDGDQWVIDEADGDLEQIHEDGSEPATDIATEPLCDCGRERSECDQATDEDE
jgi:hypothetical protein